MKNGFKLILAIVVIIVSFTSFSCDEITCDGMGTLSLENKSISTVQRIMIDGVNYGSLDPGETKDIELAPGQHLWQLEGLSGGSGCSAAYVIIVECETSSYSCSG